MLMMVMVMVMMMVVMVVMMENRPQKVLVCLMFETLQVNHVDVDGVPIALH